MSRWRVLVKTGFIFVCLISLAACQFGNKAQEKAQIYENAPVSQHQGKKVILAILDSMDKELIDKSIKEGNVPGLQFLIEQGHFYKEVVSLFPSMSVTIESSILTGTFPNQHKIPGLSWYNEEEDRIVNYGTSLEAWRRNGFSQGAYDVLYNLNQKHLSPDTRTIFEELDQKGVTGGAINTLIYRGNHKHVVDLPYLSEYALDLPRQMEIHGPKVLAFGRLIQSAPFQNDQLPDQAWQSFGIQDDFTSKAVQQLIQEGNQPDFTMIYFPDFDKETHKHGPGYVQGFEEVDKQIQGILNSYDSWEEALNETIFIFIGDHSQVRIDENKAEASIDLYELYADYQIADLEAPVDAKEIAFAVNERMAYIYDIHHLRLVPELVSIAAADERNDLIAWQEDQWVYVRKPESEDLFRFMPDGKWKDSYGQSWTIDGHPAILGLHLHEAENLISFTDYPDALQQIYSALNSHRGEKIILSAKPGYSYLSEGIPVHDGGGDHGGLHRDDMLTSMIIAGTDQKPATLRLVELKEYIVQLLSTNAEPRKHVRAKETEKKDRSRLEPGPAQKMKQHSESIPGVTEAVVVEVDQNIYVALKVKQWHRFRLKSIRKETYDLLTERYKNKRVHVSTDWKIYRELEKISQAKNLSVEKKRKKTKELEQKMKG